MDSSRLNLPSPDLNAVLVSSFSEKKKPQLCGFLCCDVSGSQLLSALQATSFNHGAAGGCLHSFAETVFHGALPFFWLIGHFHLRSPHGTDSLFDKTACRVYPMSEATVKPVFLQLSGWRLSRGDGASHSS